MEKKLHEREGLEFLSEREREREGEIKKDRQRKRGGIESEERAQLNDRQLKEAKEEKKMKEGGKTSKFTHLFCHLVPFTLLTCFLSFPCSPLLCSPGTL